MEGLDAVDRVSVGRGGGGACDWAGGDLFSLCVCVRVCVKGGGGLEKKWMRVLEERKELRAV